MVPDVAFPRPGPSAHEPPRAASLTGGLGRRTHWAHEPVILSRPCPSSLPIRCAECAELPDIESPPRASFWKLRDAEDEMAREIQRRALGLWLTAPDAKAQADARTEGIAG